MSAVAPYHPSYEYKWVDLMIHAGSNPAGIELILRGYKQNVGQIGRRRPVRDKTLLAFQYAVNIHPSDKQKRVAISCVPCEVLKGGESVAVSEDLEALADPGEPSGV